MKSKVNTCQHSRVLTRNKNEAILQSDSSTRFACGKGLTWSTRMNRFRAVMFYLKGRTMFYYGPDPGERTVFRETDCNITQ